MKANVYCVATKLSQLNEYIMRRQNHRLKAAIEKAGLGGLLNLSMPTINIELIHHLLSAWDSSSGMFKFSNGESMSLTEDDIQRVYSLPRGDEFIDVKLTKTVLLKDAAHALIERLGLEPMSRKFTIPEEQAVAKMKNYASSATDLVPLYALLAIHMLLDPPSCKKNVSMKYAYFVRDVATIKSCNWPGFVSRILRESLNAYNFGAQYARLAGDAHCLMVRYMDRFVVKELQPPIASRWGIFSISRADLLSHIGIVKERRKRRRSVEAAEGNAEEDDDAMVSETESHSDDELLSDFMARIRDSRIDTGSSFRMNELGTTSSLLGNEDDEEERHRKEADDERIRKEAEEDRLRKEAEERKRKEDEEQKKKEEQLRKEAEQQKRKEAEEQLMKEAEEQKRKAEEKERKEAEEQERKEAEEKKRKEAEEQERKEAEQQKRKEAEEQLMKEAEEQKRKA